MTAAKKPTFEFVADLTGFRAPDCSVVRLKGRLRRKRDLFRALSTQLKFPAYFGQNWDALEECLCDLTWLDSPTGVVLLHHQLQLSDPSQRKTYLAILARAQNTNRIPLRVVFPLAADPEFAAHANRQKSKVPSSASGEFADPD